MSRQGTSTRPATPIKNNREAAPAATTAVRNSPVPKPQAAAAARTVTSEMIAKRAFEISMSPQCGSEFDNWIRAERELKTR